jgi:NCS2 family nucleobase:cation symporter-2
MIPVAAPRFYARFPANFQIIFGSSITTTVVVVFGLNLLFNHLPWRRDSTAADSTAGPARDVVADRPGSHRATRL